MMLNSHSFRIDSRMQTNKTFFCVSKLVFLSGCGKDIIIVLVPLIIPDVLWVSQFS